MFILPNIYFTEFYSTQVFRSIQFLPEKTFLDSKTSIQVGVAFAFAKSV